MTKFCKEILERTTEWVAENGLRVNFDDKVWGSVTGTIKDLCEYLGISDETYSRWVGGKVEFVEAIKSGNEKFCSTLTKRLETAAVRRAMGYDRNGKHYPPDTGMLIFLLTNVRPEQWQNRQYIKGDGRLTIEDSSAWLQEVVKKRTEDKKKDE